ncbi:hypothetical protein CDAR_185001 [Caerostris darwini]|uniref:Uncharacterized protein n=1 Tax=Caerostris darwini TaxID=1538125 RepID=A0AAV4SR32_9ARAC|nr:hypothetical protein CDAR_185001 [Caerostris darwini]
MKRNKKSSSTLSKRGGRSNVDYQGVSEVRESPLFTGGEHLPSTSSTKTNLIGYSKWLSTSGRKTAFKKPSRSVR